MNSVEANLQDVEHALEELGLKNEAESEDGKRVLDPSNWTVDGQEPAAVLEVKTGSTVKLRVGKPETTN